ncbi:MAG TPA: VanZ family protein [Patescibacteria group bacterium]
MNKIISYLLVVFWCAVIFWLSSKPGLAIASGTLDFVTRKPAHIFVYFVLSILSFRALIFDYKIKKALILAFGFSLLYAISDEIHQILVPLREGKVLDIIFDATGAALAAIIIWRLQPLVVTRLLLLEASLQANMKKG